MYTCADAYHQYTRISKLTTGSLIAIRLGYSLCKTYTYLDETCLLHMIWQEILFRPIYIIFWYLSIDLYEHELMIIVISIYKIFEIPNRQLISISGFYE